MNIKTIVLSIALSATVYLAFAFGNWDLNPGRWDVGARAVAAFLIFISLVFPSLIEKEINSKS